jgi:lauroyl/myristoyl acyltransferase
LIGGLVRQPDDSYLGLVDRHIDFEPTGNRERDIQDLTQTIIGSLEKWVRQYPDQWYMFRRMWVKPDRFEPKRQEVQPKEALAQD